MADIKRAHFFTKHKLVEADLNLEQAYHVRMRRHHNASLHSWGVVVGLTVTRAADDVVRIDPGTAVDAAGREIVIEDARTHRLTSSGNNVDVFLTVAYADENSDPVTHDGVSDFIRTLERPSVVDSRTAPPSDGSVILLARIRLNASGAIASDSNGIDPSVRTLASARIVPGALDTVHLADDTVTAAQLDHDAKPLSLQASNAVTVALDDAQRRVTIGESHSARTDNPHAVTAAQVDTQGGANRLVARINAGLGVIALSRVEAAPADMAVGSVTFGSVAAGAQVLSDEIDPGLGAAPLCVQLALDDVPSAGLSMPGDTDYGRTIRYFANLNPTTGRFKVTVWRTSGAAGPVKVRWFAFKAQPGPDSSVAVAVTVTPTAFTTATASQRIDANVSNAVNTGVTWSVPDGGTLSNVQPNSVTYTPNALSGHRRVIATSVADPTKSATTDVTVNAPIFVTLNLASADVFDGRQVSLTATVSNATTNSNVSWSVRQAGGGTLSASTTPSGTAVTYTAPAAAGTYTVRAASTQDPAKFSECSLRVINIQVTIQPEFPRMDGGGALNVLSTVSGLPAGFDNRVHWTVRPGFSGSFTNTPSTSGRYRAALINGQVTVRGTSVVDDRKFGEAQISVVTHTPPPENDL